MRCRFTDKGTNKADAALVERSLGGDDSAFAELMGRHERKVRRRVYRTLGSTSEGEDAVQEVFLRAFLSLHKFNTSYSFHNWIMRIAANYCIDQLRRRRIYLRMCRSMEEADRRRMVSTATNSLYIGRMIPFRPERYEILLRRVLDALDPKYKTAFILREMEGREYAEVANILGVSEVGARVIVSRARKRMQDGFRHHLASF